MKNRKEYRKKLSLYSSDAKSIASDYKDLEQYLEKKLSNRYYRKNYNSSTRYRIYTDEISDASIKETARGYEELEKLLDRKLEKREKSESKTYYKYSKNKKIFSKSDEDEIVEEIADILSIVGADNKILEKLEEGEDVEEKSESNRISVFSETDDSKSVNSLFSELNKIFKVIEEDDKIPEEIKDRLPDVNSASEILQNFHELASKVHNKWETRIKKQKLNKKIVRSVETLEKAIKFLSIASAISFVLGNLAVSLKISSLLSAKSAASTISKIAVIAKKIFDIVSWEFIIKFLGIPALLFIVGKVTYMGLKKIAKNIKKKMDDNVDKALEGFLENINTLRKKDDTAFNPGAVLVAISECNEILKEMDKKLDEQKIDWEELVKMEAEVAKKITSVVGDSSSFMNKLETVLDVK